MINCIKSNISIKFDRSNKNAIHIRKAGKLVHMIAVPPSKGRVDVFMSKDNSAYNIDGMVVVQTPRTK